jgi:hypothetical protein
VITARPSRAGTVTAPAPGSTSMVTRPGFPPTYYKYPPPGQIMARSGKASWNPAAGPVYELHTWHGLPFAPVAPKKMMDPSDPSTWQRPYVFTQ